MQLGVLSYTGQVVEDEDDDGAMAEAVQIEMLRKAGEYLLSSNSNWRHNELASMHFTTGGHRASLSTSASKLQRTQPQPYAHLVIKRDRKVKNVRASHGSLQTQSTKSPEKSYEPYRR